MYSIDAYNCLNNCNEVSNAINIHFEIMKNDFKRFNVIEGARVSQLKELYNLISSEHEGDNHRLISKHYLNIKFSNDLYPIDDLLDMLINKIKYYNELIDHDADEVEYPREKSYQLDHMTYSLLNNFTSCVETITTSFEYLMDFLNEYYYKCRFPWNSPLEFKYRYKIDDIRECFNNDINELKKNIEPLRKVITEFEKEEGDHCMYSIEIMVCTIIRWIHTMLHKEYFERIEDAQCAINTLNSL